MVERVEWHNGLSVGIDEIDGQHRALFKAVNSFLDSVDGSSSLDDVAVVVSFLEEYVGVHFDTEERAMETHGYPLFDEHLAEHRHFKETIAYLKEKYLEWGWGTTEALKIMLQRKLVCWLTEHVSVSDKKLGAYLQDRSA
ncbi:MAG: hemerythrin family protein [Thermodesulfobacteriota bacterium]